MRRRRSRAAGAFLGVAIVLPLLAGCGEKAGERSFTDKYGRVCTYILIQEADGDKDVGDIDCDYPPSVSPPAPPPTPVPSPSR